MLFLFLFLLLMLLIYFPIAFKNVQGKWHCCSWWFSYCQCYVKLYCICWGKCPDFLQYKYDMRDNFCSHTCTAMKIENSFGVWVYFPNICSIMLPPLFLLPMYFAQIFFLMFSIKQETLKMHCSIISTIIFCVIHAQIFWCWQDKHKVQYN